MLHKIENEYLTCEIDDMGAQLHSLVSKENGKEYIWYGRTEIWYGQAPVLFPIIGQLINDTYYYNGIKYTMPKHGLARKLPFKVKECSAVPKSKKLLQFTLDDGTGKDRTILSGIHAFYEPEELIGKTLIAIVNLPPRAMMGIESCGMLLSAIHEEEGEEKLHLLMVDNHIPAGAKLY